jgi:hypothetical protein
MEPEQLSDELKDLLRLLANAIKGRRKHGDPWWIRMAHDHSMPVWQNVRNPRLWRELQELTDLGTMLALERHGFLQSLGSGHYALDEERILKAVESDFYAGSGA